MENPNARLEAFCDGVFAIALTLLIIDVKIPNSESINSTPEFWSALRHLAPTIMAFVLSFGIILITWVNHHASLNLVNKSTSSFIYSNGFLLLTVVIIPFPTALLGEYLLTDHAAPAVVLYTAVLALQTIGWWLLSNSALKNHLAIDEKCSAAMRINRRNSIPAFALYSILAISALWFPLTVAVITTATWIFWLVLGIRIRNA